MTTGPKKNLAVHQASSPDLHESRSTMLGIWRVGQTLHRSLLAELSLAQPADAVGSPRWDYVIKRASGSDSEARRQIAAFVAAASGIVHPNLVAVLDASSVASAPYLVMPRLEGETMQWHLDSSARKPVPVALWLIRQIAQSLESLHNAGWIHGDVKPENCMVGSRGHVTLVDLGFATRIHTLSVQQFRGTPAYAAPESLDGTHAAIPAMDIYSLGGVLWKWLTRVESTQNAVLEPIAELVETMLDADPTKRPTAGQVVKKLLKLEIETLGRHIGPESQRRAA